MNGLRHEVEQFMRASEHFLGFVNQDGGLTSEECEALKYYVDELSTHVTKFCGVGDRPEPKGSR
jgi:hypothetical protein